jgi:hypothetical protein
VLASSMEIRCLAVMSLAQGLTTNLMEFAWKSHMRLLYPSPQDFTAFLGDVATWTGVVTGGLMLATPLLFDRLGWRGVASATPQVGMGQAGWVGGQNQGRLLCRGVPGVAGGRCWAGSGHRGKGRCNARVGEGLRHCRKDACGACALASPGGVSCYHHHHMQYQHACSASVCTDGMQHQEGVVVSTPGRVMLHAVSQLVFFAGV